MNRNVTALILIVLAIGIYVTFTRDRVAELQAIRAVNAEYQMAINNSATLVKVRDGVLKAYNGISEIDRDRLNKIVPDNVDNVRLIIDVKDDIAAKHGLFLKNLKTTSPDAPATKDSPIGSPNQLTVDSQPGEKFGVATLSFTVTTGYENFLSFMRDLEASLRIIDVSKLSITASERGNYDFSVELKTYWLKQ